MEITVVNPNAKPVTVAIQDKSVIGVTQPGPNFVVSPVNLLSISSIINAYGDLINPGVDAGIGIAVNGDVVSIKNAANLSNGILPKWDIANGQFVDSIVQEQAGVVYVNGGLESNYWQADLLASTTTGVGKLRWNDQDGTLEFGLIGGNVNLQIGQEQVVRVVNKTGADLQEAAYQAVKVSGAQGNRLKVGLARADVDANSADTIGIVTETILSNQEGFVTSSGLVRNINTTGSIQSETWADGDILYLSPTTFGAITNIKPQAPQHTVILGFVVRAHATQGQIYVKVDNGYEIDELHNVKITSVANGQFLVYNTTLGVWENKTVNTGVNGTGITNYVARWLDTDTLTTGVLYDNGTNIGIGTTSPSAKLNVAGNLKVEPPYNIYANIISSTGASNTNLFLNGTTSYTFGLHNSGMYYDFGVTGGSSLLRILGTGNVGIGTTAPSQKLHVVGNAYVTGAYYDATNNPGTSGQLLSSTITGTQWINPPITGNTLQKYTETFVATASQTVFVTTNTLTTNNFDVFLNGSKLTPSEYTVNTSTNTITLTTGARSNDIVEVIVFSTNNLALAPIPNVSVITSNTYTISVDDEVLLIDTVVGQTIELTLPSASAASNRNYTVKNIGLGQVDIIPAATNTIDGESIIQIENQYTSLSLFPYLSNWYII